MNTWTFTNKPGHTYATVEERSADQFAVRFAFGSDLRTSHFREDKASAFVDAATAAGTLCSCGTGHPDGEVCDVKPKMYFIQDTSQVVGNCALWWAKCGGYTTHLDEAREVPAWEALRIERTRSTDKAWPTEQVRAAASLQVDVQRLPDCENCDVGRGA